MQYFDCNNLKQLKNVMYKHYEAIKFITLFLYDHHHNYWNARI